MIYLTHYTEYPIYEPAEGGYYYSGQQADDYYRFNSEKQAKRILKKMKRELEEDGYCVWSTGAYKRSKYIGDGESWIIEKVYGYNNRGRVPYE